MCDEMRLAGLDRLGEEEYDAAVELFDQAIALCPKYPDLHNLRGIALFELERLEEAVDAFALSAELGPGYLVSRLNLAFALVAAEEHRRAVGRRHHRSTLPGALRRRADTLGSPRHRRPGP